MRETETVPRRGGPVPGPLGSAMALVYRAAIGRINRRFDRGRGVVRFDRPVISVGNLNVGGTGKTPMVTHIVRVLLDAGHRPCIAMRGYAGSAGRSDEAAAYQREFPEVPLVAQPNRTLGLIELFGRQHEQDDEPSDCIVLDDGFQHRQIARDLDIVLIDATRDPFADRLLPAGWLREPVTSLRRAGFVVLTHAESVDRLRLDELRRQITAIRGGAGVDGVAKHDWSGLVVEEGEVDRDEPVEFLRGQRVFAVCAIGNPQPFLAAARQAGGSLAGQVVLRDHHAYGQAALHRIVEEAKAARAEVILTTEKDWSKLESVPAEMWPCPVARPRLRIAFTQGESTLREAVLSTVARGVPAEDETGG